MIGARSAATRHWYKPVNHRRIQTQIAAQRFIAELAEQRRITRGQKMLLDELARFVDAKGTTQKSIAFLAKRCRVAERTIQTYLRGLCPSKAERPEAWATRVLTRRYIHLVSDRGKADNVPSWFTIEIPERFFTPKGPRRVPADPRPASSPRSPGGVEKITQAVILGSDPVERTKTLHPCTNLRRSAASPPKPAKPHAPPAQAAPTPAAPSRGGGEPPEPPALVVKLCAQLFPSHAPVAHKAVARLAALGWTENTIARYLRKASEDASLGRASHPLLTAVWLAEREFRSPPPRSPRPVETALPDAETSSSHANTPPTPPALLERIERAKAAQRAGIAKSETKRRRKALDPPDDQGGGP